MTADLTESEDIPSPVPGPAMWLVMLITTVTFSIGAWWKLACTDPFKQLCYTDITPLYTGRGLFDGISLYLEQFNGRYLEYPVLIGVLMQAAGDAVHPGDDFTQGGKSFLLVTSVMLLLLALATVALTWHTQPGTTIRALGSDITGELRRTGPRAALMIAASPLLLLEGTINWDLLAVALTAAALLAWSRDAPLLTGMFLGLGAAAKLYPLLILGPLIVMCARRARWGAMGRAVGAAAVAWLVCNLPVMALNFDGWREFYSFSQTRGIDFGSPWLAWAYFGGEFTQTSVANSLGTGLFLLACVGVAVLAWLCPSATLAQLAFLVVAAFALTNKVYSPQYALWLLPLAALARPRWPALIVWQLGEVVYFVAIWRFLLSYGKAPLVEGAIDQTQYAWAIVLHIVLTTGFAALVVVDVVRESHRARQTQRTRSALVVE